MTAEGLEVYRLSKKISRFLERYDPNNTNRALDAATMLIFADKYACLVEAVTALVMMSHMGNSLYWNEGLFRWNMKWDIQSKDYIARLHSELRIGCIDDLDFACKLFALYSKEVSNIPDAIINSWGKRYFINEDNFELIRTARDVILKLFTRGKKTNVFRPIDFSLVEGYACSWLLHGQTALHPLRVEILCNLFIQKQEYKGSSQKILLAIGLIKKKPLLQ